MKSRIPNVYYCSVTAALALLTETGVRAQIGGVPVWTNYYGISDPNNHAQPSDLAVDASGNVFVTGEAEGDFATVKYSAAGVPLWTNRFNGPADDYDAAGGIAVDSSGNAFVTGYSRGSGSATLKYSAAGVPLWTNYLAGGTGSIAVDKNGKVFVAGSTGDILSTTGDFLTVAYSNTGVPLWTNYYNGPENGNDYIRDVAVDGSGNVVVTGDSAGGAATIKYSGTGVPLWTNRNEGYAADVAVDGSGNAFVTGGLGYWGLTIKYSSAGVPLWTNIYKDSTGGVQAPAGGHALALDSSGNIYVAGSSFNSLTGSNDFLTLKYSAAGVPLWTNFYNGPDNMYDLGGFIAVDAVGNVFVYGDSRYSDIAGDVYIPSFTTLAYSSGGMPLWTNRFASASAPGDYESTIAMDMAVDGSGNVFVLGQTSLRGYVIIKYSSALPRLTIHRTSTNTVVISWPSLSTGFTLQQNTDANRALSWSNVSAGIQDDGTTKTLVVDPASDTRFYRLSKL
jgi:hypothetical protein